MSLCINGLGTAVPAHRMSQGESADLARKVICQTDEQARLLTVLYRRAGVKHRHTVLPHRMAMNWAETSDPDSPLAAGVSQGPSTGERMKYFAEHASPLAQQAARRAIDNAGVRPQQITHLITVCCTGFAAPGVDTHLITELEMRPTTERIQVGFMGCHGALNGVRVARALTTADPQARVLLCAVELCSLHYAFQWEPERIVANAVFADGAAALVASGSESAAASDAWRVAATGSCLLPDSQDAMSWRIGDHGFEMTLSARVPDLIHQHLRPWLTEWLAMHGQRIDTIGSWGIHPGGPRILSACGDALGLGKEQLVVSQEVLAEFGNMSSPTVLFILERLQQRNAPRPCVSLAFGPGLAAEAVLFV